MQFLRKQKHTMAAVIATCTDVRKYEYHRRNGARYFLFAPEWEYTFKGRQYRTLSEQMEERYMNVRIGDRYEIHVNPENPEEIRFERDAKIAGIVTAEAIVLLFAAAVLIGVRMIK